MGLIACYLIEAIIRDHPYFTYRLALGRLGLPGGQLHEAACAYEEWYEECFDKESSSIACAPDRVPKVEWPYVRNFDREICHDIAFWKYGKLRRAGYIGRRYRERLGEMPPFHDPWHAPVRILPLARSHELSEYNEHGDRLTQRIAAQ